VAQNHKSFERLSHVLEQIGDDDIANAIAWIRECRAGRGLGGSQQPLMMALEQLERDELTWLEMVLCVRAQQAGREAAWRRFAESSYRDFVAFY